MKIFTRTTFISTLAIGALALSACSTDEAADSVSDATSAAGSVAASATSEVSKAMKDKDHDHDDMDKEDGEAHSGLHMHDAVVRAMDETSDMTAIFGEIHNSTDKEVTIVGFKSSVDAKMNQIHEVTDGVMKEKEGGITLAAGEDIDLEPGGYHFMLMGVAKPIMAGETVDLTLELKDGSTIDVKGIPVRTMGAGAEGYEDMHGHDHDDHDGHDHDDHDHDDHDHDDHDHDHDDKN